MNVKIKEKIKAFERHLKGEERAKNTIEKYLRDINRFYCWFTRRGELCELEVTKEVLLEYKEYLKTSKLKVSSINSKISSLNAYFTYIEDETLKLKVIKCQKSLFGSKEKELTTNEFSRLYEAAKKDDRLRLLIETIAKTGARVSEVKYITVESLEIGKAMVDNKGKVRVILIPRKLCKILKNYSKKERINTGSIFLTRNGTPLDRKQIWQMMKDLAKKANVNPDKVFPHNLRHLFAREFFKWTHDIVKLASILGHSSIETTRIYTKETEDECRVEMERVMILRE